MSLGEMDASHKSLINEAFPLPSHLSVRSGSQQSASPIDLLLAASSAAQSSTSRSSAATNSVQILQSISENGNDYEEAEYDDEDEDEDEDGDDNDSNDDCSVEEEYNEAVIAACNNTDVDDINLLIIAEQKKQNCR